MILFRILTNPHTDSRSVQATAAMNDVVQDVRISC
jgi:hypothetical protein